MILECVDHFTLTMEQQQQPDSSHNSPVFVFVCLYVCVCEYACGCILSLLSHPDTRTKPYSHLDELGGILLCGVDLAGAGRNAVVVAVLSDDAAVPLVGVAGRPRVDCGAAGAVDLLAGLAGGLL
jgi:hypothetical protein